MNLAYAQHAEMAPRLVAGRNRDREIRRRLRPVAYTITLTFIGLFALGFIAGLHSSF